MEPWLFRSRDLGATFTRLVDGLPADNLHGVAESPRRRGLLFAASSRGVSVSLDDGDRFAPLDANLPTVPVFELVVHPRDPELVAATHGRGIWIADIAAVEELSHDVLARPAALLEPRTVAPPPRLPGSSSYAAPRFQGENPFDGVELWYWLRDGVADAAAETTVPLVVRDIAGRTIATLQGPARPGLHAVRWNLTIDLQQPGVPALRDRRLGAGDYLVTLELPPPAEGAPAEAPVRATLRVETHPAFAPRTVTAERGG